jgi:hypothetical protein
MNDRIKELYDQCFTHSATVDHLGIPFVDFKLNPEKFAELIIKECAKIALESAIDTNFVMGVSAADKRAMSIAAQITTHFGVK